MAVVFKGLGMSKVDPAVQHTIENTGAIYRAILELWAITPIEMKMYIAVMFSVSILLQYYKKTMLRGVAKRERIIKLWAASMPLGILISFCAYFIYEGRIHYGWFIFTGLTASTVSMGVHKVTVDFVWPGIKTVGSAFWSRAIMLIRGKQA